MNALLASPRHRIVRVAAIAALAFAGAAHAQHGDPASKPAIDIANPLVGTAALDQKTLIGNAPPPGEMLYSGQTSPIFGAVRVDSVIA